jgi:hypothetical protein
MARKRMIDPNFWIDEKLGRISREARLMFMGCISQSDDDGRLQGHTALLKSLIFPYDLDITLQEVEDWLNELDKEKLIIRYEVANQKYVEMPNFSKHQTINKRTPSKLPAPPKKEDYGSPTVVGEEQDSNTTSQKKRREEKGIEEKVSESPDPSLDNLEIIKDEIHQLAITCKIKKLTLHELDRLFSYIGMVDKEIIEAAIKKGEGKHVNYALTILDDLYKEGITKKEQLFEKPEQGKKNTKTDTLPPWIAEQSKKEKEHKPPDNTEDDEAREKRIKELLEELGEGEANE